jgi:hypothetical protein
VQKIVKYCQDKKNGKIEFITIRGEKYHVWNDKLDLSELKISDITEIEGLETLTNLQVLELHSNQIDEIKGLENLINLKKLCLGWNQIEEIKGLENLKNLQELYLDGNPIKEEETHLLEKSAQEVVTYCQEKVKQS